MTPASREIVWTPERLKTLKTLIESGVRHREVARILGTTRGACTSAYHRKILPFLEVTKEAQGRLETDCIMNGEEIRAVPNLAFVPGLAGNPKYRMTNRIVNAA